MGHPVTLTEANFPTEVTGSEGLVLVDFWASWCMPCRAIAPSIEELAGEYEGRVKVAKLDVDENTQLAAAYGVMSIPTLLLFRGGEVVDRVVGAQPKSVIQQHLERALGQA